MEGPNSPSPQVDGVECWYEGRRQERVSGGGREPQRCPVTVRGSMATPGQEEAWLPPHGPESTSCDGSGDPAQPRSSAVTVRSSIFLNQQRSRVLWTRHGHSPLTAVMHRELRALAQGRPARKGHNWDLDSDHLVPMSRQRCPAPSQRALSDTTEHQPPPPRRKPEPRVGSPGVGRRAWAQRAPTGRHGSASSWPRGLGHVA